MSGTPYCPSQYPSTSKQSQWPSEIWSSTSFTGRSDCSGEAAVYTYYLEGAVGRQSSFCATTYAGGGTHFGSVRCCFGFRVHCILTECSYSSVSGTPYCPWQGPSKQDRRPDHIWSSTTFTNSNCTGGTTYRARYLDGSSWGLGWFCATTLASTHSRAGYTEFGSVRCCFGFRVQVYIEDCSRVQVRQRKRSTVLSGAVSKHK